MTDSNEAYEKVKKDVNDYETSEVCFVEHVDVNTIVERQSQKNTEGTYIETAHFSQKKIVNETADDNISEENKNSSNYMGALISSSERPENSSGVLDKPNNEKDSIVPPLDIGPKTFSEKITQNNSLFETESKSSIVSLCEEKEIPLNPIVNKVTNLPDGYTDSSQSSSSELQSSAAPFESSCSSQEVNYSASHMNFENAIESAVVWPEKGESEVAEISSKSAITLPQQQPESISSASEIPVITIDENTEPSPSVEVPPVSNLELPPYAGPGFPSIPGTQDQPIIINNQSEVKVNEEVNKQPEPAPMPILPPAPRKRGRPRKQVLPNPSPIVESWGPNAQEFPSLDANKEGKRSMRAERRQAKKKKFEDEGEGGQDGEEDSSKRRFVLKPPIKKKKRRAVYTPKRKLPPPKKKPSELENIQNFEEETRMSASEAPTGFSSRSGVTGDESQGSSVTAESHTRANINKKGRMEVMTDGCKPVTVQQIVEYFWPPPSSLPHGEKPEGLMIQEQISEYLGVKSFKRKYPSIKRRPVDMEERNYLQENGYVSENMCDLGLTAVFSADIIEIMYNDFPQKFEEYRKYTREKKAKEQRALRERQAAERADMDPKKEAVESALSWNNEFNKTRSSKVLLGNWFNKNCEDEYKLAMHLKKKERKKLLVIEVQKLFEIFLRHVPLAMPTKGLSYGGTIQLRAPDTVSEPPHTVEKFSNGLVLTVTFDLNDIDKIQGIIEDLEIVGSPFKEPCARNAFVIESAEDKAEGEAVCYGDTFILRSAGSTESPLYIELPVPALSCPVGKCGFPNPKLKKQRSRNSRFTVVHVRPDLRGLMEGLPISPFERVMINHAPNNSSLCVENECWKMNFFSYETEISANPKSNFKEYMSPYLWIFLVGSGN